MAEHREIVAASGASVQHVVGCVWINVVVIVPRCAMAEQDPAWPDLNLYRMRQRAELANALCGQNLQRHAQANAIEGLIFGKAVRILGPAGKSDALEVAGEADAAGHDDAVVRAFTAGAFVRRSEELVNGHVAKCP